MPKRVTKQELDQLVALLAPHKQGLSVTELERESRAQGVAADRRTLQRRIAELLKAQRVVKLGRGRASRYRAAPIAATIEITEAPDVLVAQAEVYVPLSPQGAEVKKLVRRPISERTPVGYRRAFLDDYEPNRSFYLPETLRAHLHAIGRSPLTDPPPAGTYARDIMNRLLVDLAWASSRLEGNTYTLLDTRNLIEFGHAAEGKDARETQMILNHKAAIEMLVENAERIGFDMFTFLNLHALLSENLLPDPDASGRLRTTVVAITGTVFHPLAGPQLIEECFRTILDKTTAIRDSFEQAFFLMVQIPYLQPFLDVNKRVSRLGANIPFIKRNLSPLSFVDVPERAYIDGTLGVYELNRVELLRDVFVWAYERSCQRYVAIKESLPEPDPLRLRYRAALIEVVGNIVRGGKSIDTSLIREIGAALVPAADLDQFVAMAFNDLHRLHDGNVARYRLRLPEYRAWKQSLDEKR